MDGSSDAGCMRALIHFVKDKLRDSIVIQSKHKGCREHGILRNSITDFNHNTLCVCKYNLVALQPSVDVAYCTH